MNNKPANPLVLVILDGFGLGEPSRNNAIHLANTPTWDNWCQQGSMANIDASGHAVGLPDKQMGNSEVGHMHIGAGRVIKQDLSRINDAISDQSFFSNAALLSAVEAANINGKTVHLVGLVSDGGVHSHQDHLHALLELLRNKKATDVCIHAITDGRDTPPQSAKGFIGTLEKTLTAYPFASTASISGRFYAMDRDNRWDRVQAFYDMLTQSKTTQQSATDIIESAYQNQVTDEFIPPTPTQSHRVIEDGDVVICFNFRSDRMREITQALSDSAFTAFERTLTPNCQLITMTAYDKTLKATVAFAKEEPKNTLGECIANLGLKQLRVAETEKYAHVTFFLNGGREAPFSNEERALISSPKVATYDLKPEMSAIEVTDTLVKAINSESYQLIICNYANADMVGHTGNLNATIQAIETLDACFSRLEKAATNHHTELLITADHGNAEKMFDEKSSQQHTAHTDSRVPLVHVGSSSSVLKSEGALTDIAPTVLHLLHLTIPLEMTGEPLISLTTD